MYALVVYGYEERRISVLIHRLIVFLMKDTIND
jgi:hypothetical protein